MRRIAPAGLLIVLLTGACTGDPAPRPSATEHHFAPGASGVGDTYYPEAGNGGYDVAGYDLAVKFNPKDHSIAGTATITASSVQDLSAFNLDLSVQLDVAKVTVDGKDATQKTGGGELTVTPAAGIPKGRQFTVVVTYGGKPNPSTDPTLGVEGWTSTADGGAFVLGEPESAATWYPANDHPSDKATFKLAMTVPDGLQVISNGVPGPHESAAGWTTWHWAESSPMATYLSMVVIGHYDVTTTTHDGKPMILAVPTGRPVSANASTSIARTGEIVDFLASKFGPYPFDAYGGVVVDDSRLGYALETQSRPVYGATFFERRPNYQVVAHELAHQWFGDSVSLRRWQDIWLNEGFAHYAEWLYKEHFDNVPVGTSFSQEYDDFGGNWVAGAGVPGEPGQAHMFGPAVYTRGGMTLYALRKKIGDSNFDKLLTTWTAQHRDGNATTDDFMKLAESVSGQDLKAFFQAWLFTAEKPDKP